MPEKVTITKSKLDSLAEVIGSKSNQNVPLTIEGMEDAVLSLITPIGTKLITENGTYDVTNYANTKIDVPEVFVITPTYAYSNGPTWTIDKTYDEVDAAYTAGKTIVVDATIFHTDYYQHCTATFFMDQDDSYQSYTIMIGWYDNNNNLYHEQYYDADSINKTWNLAFQNEYEYPKSLTEKTITANGTYDPTQGTSGSYANGYSKVTVNVPPTTLQPLTITPSTEQQVFNASFQMSDTALMNELYLWKNNSTSFNILLTVGTNYWLILTRYSGNMGWTDSQISKVYDPVLWTATEDYSYPFSLQNESAVRVRYNSANNIENSWRYKISVYPVASSTAYAPVTVEPIPSEYTVPTLQAKTNINPTISSQTITADSGYDGLSSVQINAMPNGTAGTPVATKGTVSNNSITVTPSVTNTTGYITGSTKTGTAVTISASELVSGTYNITENNTYDVTNLASVTVSVPTGGGITQDANGYLVLDDEGGSSPSPTSSGSSPWTLLKSTEFTTSTTSTSATSLGTITVDDNPVFTSEKMIFVKVRDKAGKRNGYFYGCDTVFVNDMPANNIHGVCYNAVNKVYSVKADGTWNLYQQYSTSGTTKYGVAASQIQVGTAPYGWVYITERYSSTNTGTIDGTYTVDVYSLDWPDGVSPFDAEVV